MNYKQFLWQASPGMKFTNNFKRASIYTGFELPFIHIGDADQTESITTTQTNIYNQKNTGSSTTTAYIPGGYMVGAGTFVGLNFFVAKHVTIGPDLSFALYYSNLGGTYHQETITYNENNEPGAFFVYENSNSLRQLAFSGLMGAINVNFIIP
jgi:hypothetical protein